MDRLNEMIDAAVRRQMEQRHQALERAGEVMLQKGYGGVIYVNNLDGSADIGWDPTAEYGWVHHYPNGRPPR